MQRGPQLPYRKSPRRRRLFVWIVVLAVFAIGAAAVFMMGSNRTESPSISEPVSVPSVSSLAPSSPHLRHIDEKRFMLQLINDARVEAGFGTVELGTNDVAQLHAESSLERCFGSHWGIDGLKPYMRYSLVGGYQTNSENFYGTDYCVTDADGIPGLSAIEDEIRERMAGWMESPEHRLNLLDPMHKKVNIGLAWDDYNFNAVQHYEGDYVHYDQLPYITDGFLSFAGEFKNEAHSQDEEDFRVQIYFDQTPHALTRGQLARTYCYDSGLPIAGLRPPPKPGSFYTDHEATQHLTGAPCTDPYEIDPETAAPTSHQDAVTLWQEARDLSRTSVEWKTTFPWVTADEWAVAENRFAVSADISEVIESHGDGVYTVILWGEIDGIDAPISQYSIFIPLRATTGLTPSEHSTLVDYALGMINDARTAEGLDELVLDTNTAAQSHAKDSRDACTRGHWGPDGMKPYMRYTLAGGEQYSSENVFAIDFCPQDLDNYDLETPREQIDFAMDRFLKSQGHRRTILDPHHRKVGIGLTYRPPTIWFVQLFIGDYIEYETKPQIDAGVLTLSGRVKNGVELSGTSSTLTIYYDPPLKPLTRGQLSRTYCYNNGQRIANIRRPLEPVSVHTDDEITIEVASSQCPDPYDIPAASPPPMSNDEAQENWRQARDVSQTKSIHHLTIPLIMASEWYVTNDAFNISADISDLLDQHGNGIYTIMLWGEIDGERVPISEYSIFIPLLP